MSVQTPYLSIVVTTRNDRHGGDMLGRTRAFVNGLLYHTRRCRMACELIIVEWNPPAASPPLREVLPAPQPGDFLTIRYIIVPEALHRRRWMSEQIPLFQMSAKNVGIRRACGEFVLCTNVDILFSDACFDRIARRDFRSDTFYRANRLDIPDDVLKLTSVSEQLQYAAQHPLKRLGKNRHLKHVRGIPDYLYRFKRLTKLLDIPWGWYDRLQQGKMYDLLQLDTMACGDFTLMHKNAWLQIDGYAELDMYSIHVDTLALYAAHLAGMKQEIFEWYECVYHIHHSDGWETLQDDLSTLRFLIKKPGLDWWLVVRATLQMKKEGITRYDINPPDWGLANEQLEEITLSPSEA
ncbi:MAG: hypothetical protein NZM35_04345 [Chitinophagales bacterium]|nr:hypothetical protein [Chitinophagales bacterium]MDW8418680.1 hypothetical protein [Chitinophagales bacterium]